MSHRNYKAIGLMSGSSLDGLDIAYVEFELRENQISNWQLLIADTIPLSEQWQVRLHNLPSQSAINFAKTNTFFAHYMGDLVNNFIAKHQIDPDFIASHGHTIYHYPDKRMTVQIGDGGALAAITGYPVINDFRTQDIAINGEGTPIAPIADKLLFEGYDFYLNIGGIANISCNANGKFIAFDIAPANQVLNAIAQQLDLDFDKDGYIASQAEVDNNLLEELTALEYFKKPYPKSLDNVWIRQQVLPIVFNHENSWDNKLNTVTQLLAQQTVLSIKDIIAKENLSKNQYSLLTTGGGTKNKFLIDCINHYSLEKLNIDITVPDEKIIDYKEAILMALMGVLRIENIPNCISSVTGAKWDTIGGAIYQGTKKII